MRDGAAIGPTTGALGARGLRAHPAAVQGRASQIVRRPGRPDADMLAAGCMAVQIAPGPAPEHF